MMNMFVLTSEQRTHAQTLDDDGNATIDPRAIDNASPGVGININDAASDFEPGETVALVGKFIAPKRIVDDPAYQLYCPNLIPYLLTLPFCSLESETIFAPFVDV
jgi:hypothetical protein